MYTEGKNLIINSPLMATSCATESFTKLVAEVRASRASMAEINEQLDSRRA